MKRLERINEIWYNTNNKVPFPLCQASIMKYKYGEIEYLYIPEEYRNEEFDKIVAEWQETLKNEGL